MDLDFRQWVLDPSPESDLFWNAWIKNNPNHVRELLLAKEIVLNLEFSEKPTDHDRYDRVLGNVLAGQYSSRSGKQALRFYPIEFAKKYLKVAAVLVLTGFLLAYFYFMDDQSDVATITATEIIVKENPAGRKSRVSLPDGTIVWLNSESSISYQANLEDNTRSVELTGEAYFDVAEDMERPFTVKTSNCLVTALGTEFNVKAYPENLSHQISLSEGKVSVEGLYEAISEGVILQPGESLSVDEQGSIRKSHFDESIILAWKSGVLRFEDASLQDVVKSLERWYGKKFIVEGSANEQWMFSSEFHNETLENVLNSMSYAKEFEYEINNDLVILNLNAKKNEK